MFFFYIKTNDKPFIQFTGETNYNRTVCNDTNGPFECIN